MAIESFQLKYDGPALADHSIEINDLAPALLGLSELLDEANHLVNGDRATMSLKIKATEPGSFQVNIQASQSFVEQAMDFFTGKGVTALGGLKTILDCVFLASTSSLTVLALVRKLKGKPPKAVAAIPDRPDVEIELEDGEKLIASKQVWEICQSHKSRKAIYRMMKPLEKDGIEELQIMHDSETIVRVTKSELEYFVPPDEVQLELQVTERETFVSIVNLWFTNGNKWKFSEGGNTFSAVITDSKFLDKLQADEVAFHRNDTLKVKLKHTQFQTHSGLKSDYVITEVIDHIKGRSQPNYTGPKMKQSDISELLDTEVNKSE